MQWTLNEDVVVVAAQPGPKRASVRPCVVLFHPDSPPSQLRRRSVLWLGEGLNLASTVFSHLQKQGLHQEIHV